MSRWRFLPRTVIVLSLVSFMNDAASEMITPLLPLFLTLTLGSGAAVLGLVEGLAEAASSLLKLASGYLSDRGWSRRGLVVGGYALANVARPLIGLAGAWPAVLLLRFLDRVGKGIRTSPRDALIAASTPAHWRGRAFGLHRAMDNAGAVVGPVLAWLLLQQEVGLRDIFLLSVIPGAIVMLLLLTGLKDLPPAAPAPRPPPLKWRLLHPQLRGLIIAATGLALASAPEAFLVLWAAERGLEIPWIPLLWAAASLVKSVLAAPAGWLSDHAGRLPVALGGWGLRIAVLVALALTGDAGGDHVTWLLFLAYAGSLALTEAVERALVGDVAGEQERGTAFGLFHMCVGLAALPGALIFGGIWQLAGSAAAFGTAAAIAALSVMLMLWQLRVAADR
ncbi:MAG: MFS transporter [Gammaproteobacteria bacterium]|nr:MAG: MFS transporter [Gammaproteobacteria bacterium]